MADTNNADTASTLILLGDEEYVLRASRGRVVFENYGSKTSLEQAITLTLDSRHDGRSDSMSATEDAVIPVITSIPSTPRFELFSHAASSSPFECMLALNSPRLFAVKFRPPEVSESDYAWDNFQDQVVVHTKLSKLVVRLEAWKNAAPVDLARRQESSLLFPVSLPDVKALPLRRFGAVERNADKENQPQCEASSRFTETTKKASSVSPEKINNFENLSKHQTPRTEALPSLSRPTSSERQSNPLLSSRGSPSVNATQPALPVVTAVQSQREAREVILKLRRRRTYHAKVSVGVSPTSVADTELFPETVALDADTKADLEKFNNLVVAARDQVSKETEKAKSELAYYQQLLPMPPSPDFPSEKAMEIVEPNISAQKSKKPRQMSAAMQRPSKLPSLTRPSSGSLTFSTPNTTISSGNNQEHSPLKRAHQLFARQRSTARMKLQFLPCLVGNLKSSRTTRRKSANNQDQCEQTDALSDFDDPDPEIDEAPYTPDDLSGVATLDGDD